MDDSVIVQEKEVMCGGETVGTAPNHPRVFLCIQHENKIECPYCGKVFIYEGKS
jgi:uncharacterized Zn-finger protein